MKKAVILARVSTARQEEEGLSLDNQLDTMKEYAERLGFEVVEVYRFSESADQKIRKKFAEMISYVKARPSIDALIAYRVDRITRNYRDAVLIDELRIDYDKEIHFVYDRLVISKDTVGRDMTDWDLKVFLAKQYLNRLKEDATVSYLHKLKAGEWPGFAPFGYKNTIREDGKKWVEPAPQQARILQAIYEWYATGANSMLTIRDKVAAEFSYKLSKGQIDAILKNPFPAGNMIFKGEVWPHKYEVLISREVYSKVQAIKARHGKKRFKFAGLPYAYRGLIRCSECGCLITPERAKGYVYYHCTQSKYKHGASWLREEELTRQLTAIFKSIQIPDKVLHELTETLKHSHDAKASFQANVRSDQEAEYKKYQNRIEKMYLDKLDGSITESEYAKNYNEFRQQQEAIRVRLDRLESADKEYYITASYLLKLANKAPELIKSSEPEQKRHLIKFALQNLRLEGEKVLYEAKKPFDLMASCAENKNWLHGQDSNL